MKKVTLTVYLLLFCATISLSGCGLFDGEVRPEWENLGFSEQSAYVLFLDGNDLYVGAGYDGLWAADISKRTAEWEYLGHRVTDGERHFGSGVKAIDVYNEEIRIRAETYHESGRRVGVWLSTDRGETWMPGDNGMFTERHQSFWPSAFARNPHIPNLILAGNGTVFRSRDNGDQWERVYPEPESPYRYTSLYFGLKWHPANADVIWAYGETNRFQPWLMRSGDGGTIWEEYFQVNVPKENAFYSMAFDAGNPDILYIGAQAAVIRSQEGGAEWLGEDPVPALFTDSWGNAFYALQTHPSRAGILFAGAAGRLYASRNHGDTVTILDTPKELTFILDMWYDEHREVLYVAGDGGVFRLRNPVEVIR